MESGEKYKVSKKIEAETSEEHEEKLGNEIKKIQLFYADQAYQKLLKSSKDEADFFDVLKQINSYVISDLYEVIEIENNNLEGRNSDKTRELMNAYADTINALYKEFVQQSVDAETESESFTEREEKLEKVLRFVQGVKENSKKEFPEKWAEREHSRTERNTVGLFEVNVSNESNHSDIVKKLEKEGFSRNDDFLEIHLPNIYAQKTGLSPATIKESFEKLASAIVDTYPQVQAVVGSSWLFDHPAVVRRTHFKIIEGEGRIVWSQFIDQTGQIDQIKLMNLIETGEVPYKTRTGYIGTIDFLKQYLPKEKRGKVILKEIDENWLDTDDYFEETFKNVKQFFKKWNEGEFKSQKELFDYFDNEERELKENLQKMGIFDDFINLLSDNIGKTIEEMKKIEETSAMLRQIEKRADEYRKKQNENKYKEKVVNFD